MRLSSFILCSWPGLGPLWLRGSWGGLLSAAGAGGLLNFVVLGTFVWPNLAGDELPTWLIPGVGWFAVAVLWIGGSLQSRKMLTTWATPPLDDGSERLFRQAQNEYLKGRWVAAERAIEELLKRRPADAEGRLLLATVLRRMKRFDDARRALDLLSELPASARWEREIREERALLAAPPAKTESPAAERAPAESPLAPPRINPATRETQPEPTDEVDDEELNVIAFERVEQERLRRKAA